MSASLIDLLTIVAVITILTIVVTRWLGWWLVRTNRVLAAAVCGLAVPAAGAVYACVRMRSGAGIGDGDASGPGAILLIAALATPLSLGTSILMIWSSAGRRP